jgi:hypothetical protein
VPKLLNLNTYCPFPAIYVVHLSINLQVHIMTEQRFLISQGDTKADFIINGDAVTVRLASISGMYNDTTVSGTGLLRTVLKAFRQTGEAALNYNLRIKGLSAFDTSQTLTALSEPLNDLNAGRLCIVGSGTESDPYRFENAQRSTVRRIYRNTDSDEIFASACVAAVRRFNNSAVRSAVHLAGMASSFG